MSEELARAVGAGDLKPEVICGREVPMRPLTLVELQEVERECLRCYRRRYMEAYRDGLAFLPAAELSDAMRRKADEAARWEACDLPWRELRDRSRLEMTPGLSALLADRLGWRDDPSRPERGLACLAAALDGSVLSEEEYAAEVGRGSPRVKVPYDRWWVGGTVEGMLAVVWAWARPSGLGREEVERELAGQPARLALLEKRIELLSSLQLGNAGGPA